MELLAQHRGPDPETVSLIDWEYRRELYLQAARLVQRDVQPETWRAFELTVIDGISNQAAANQLGKSLGTIYTARCRVMQRLRDVITELEESDK